MDSGREESEKQGRGERERGERERVKKRTAFHPKFYSHLLLGLSHSLSGISTALQTSTVRSYYKRFLVRTLLIIGITYAFIFIATLPLRLVASLFGYHMEMDYQLLLLLSSFVPQMYFVATECWSVVVASRETPSHSADDASETLFFETIRSENEELAEYLRGQERLKWWKAVWVQVKRSLKFVVALLILGLLSLIPTYGKYLVSLSLALLQMQIVGREVAIVFAVLSFIPQVRPFSSGILHLMLTCNRISREVLLPYTARLKNTEEYHYLFRRYFGTILGFSLPFALLFMIPIVGIFAYPLSQAACGGLVLNILHRNIHKNKAVPLMGEECVRRT